MKKIKNVFRFPSDMYVSPIGSYVISCFLLSGESSNEVAINGIKARWETAVKRKKKFDLCDLQGIADYFPKNKKGKMSIIGSKKPKAVEFYLGNIFSFSCLARSL